jgi:hypothetical protein
MRASSVEEAETKIDKSHWPQMNADKNLCFIWSVFICVRLWPKTLSVWGGDQFGGRLADKKVILTWTPN